MFCEIFNENQELVLTFPVKHFSERIFDEKDKIFLSIIYPTETGYVTDETLNQLAPLMNVDVSEIIIYNDTNEIVAKFNRYNKCAGISNEYNPVTLRTEVNINFNRSIN